MIVLLFAAALIALAWAISDGKPSTFFWDENNDV